MKLDEGDPKLDRLKPLSEDTEGLWSFEFQGSNKVFTIQNGENEIQRQEGVVIV